MKIEQAQANLQVDLVKLVESFELTLIYRVDSMDSHKKKHEPTWCNEKTWWSLSN